MRTDYRGEFALGRHAVHLTRGNFLLCWNAPATFKVSQGATIAK
jgi:hypothetical protein